MARAAHYDFSTLWRHERAYLESMDDGGRPVQEVRDLAPAAVIGFCGPNYQRFYIHYRSVKKDPVDPYLYHVEGQTRLGPKRGEFSGTLRLRRARMDKYSPYGFYPNLDAADPSADEKPFEYGQLEAELRFEEATGGMYAGRLRSSFHLRRGRAYLVSTDEAGDVIGLANEVLTTWTDAQGGRQASCNWSQGDRIPGGEALVWHGDDRVDYIREKYYRYGWASYGIAQRGYGSAKEERAWRRAEHAEKLKWWLK